MKILFKVLISILILAYFPLFACAIEQGEVVQGEVIQDEVILETDTLQKEIYEKHKKMFSRKDVIIEKNRDAKKEPVIVDAPLAEKLKKIYK